MLHTNENPQPYQGPSYQKWSLGYNTLIFNDRITLLQAQQIVSFTKIYLGRAENWDQKQC